jgi:hypothetical protein
VSTEDEKLERFAGTYGWVFGRSVLTPLTPMLSISWVCQWLKVIDGGKTFNVVRGEKNK